MGIMDKRREAAATDAARDQRDDAPGQRWEYLARNLAKVAGMALERDFNDHGADGWEFVAVAKDYAIFKRPI